MSCDSFYSGACVSMTYNADAAVVQNIISLPDNVKHMMPFPLPTNESVNIDIFLYWGGENFGRMKNNSLTSLTRKIQCYT